MRDGAKTSFNYRDILRRYRSSFQPIDHSQIVILLGVKKPWTGSGTHRETGFSSVNPVLAKLRCFINLPKKKNGARGLLFAMTSEKSPMLSEKLIQRS